MINLHDNYWIPGEGFKYLTNGTVFTTGICLGKADNIGNWHDTNDDPPTPEEEIPDSEALSIIMGGVSE